MEQRRFDDLTRRLGANSSRRTVLKGLLAGAVGGFAGLVGGGEALAAKGSGGSNKPDCCPSSAPRLCDYTCVNVSTDPNHCGGCASACPTGATCQNGACLCPQGTMQCGNACVDTSSDSNNCGTCGHVCASGQSCVAGSCASSCSPDCTGKVCGDDGCGGSCGACPGANCVGSTFQAAATCSADGTTCIPGTTMNCDPYNCSQNGTCLTTCAGDFDCEAGNCCESGTCKPVDTLTDPNNCGSCGHVCSAPNATMACTGGNCVVAACNEGFGDCDNDPLNGCETSLNTDANCGTCGNVCPSGTSCNAGVCI